MNCLPFSNFCVYRERLSHHYLICLLMLSPYRTINFGSFVAIHFALILSPIKCLQAWEGKYSIPRCLDLPNSK